jgi:acetyl esterase
VPLDPDLHSLLVLLEALGRAPVSEGTPEAARADMRMLTVDLRPPDSVPPVASSEPARVDGAEGPLQARVYRPETDAPRVPTVVFFHGGGFVTGDLDTHDVQARWLCREVEAVVVSVDYRLAPESPFPAAVEDAVAAIRWAGAHVEDLGGDPDRLALAGDSAGGNLAAVAAQAARDAGGPRLAAQLLVYPAADLVDDAGQRYPSRLENGEGLFLSAQDLRWFGRHYIPDGVDRRDPRLSPLHGDLADLPPAVVVTAELDPLRDEGRAYARALEEAGVKVATLEFDGLVHGFFGMAAAVPACERAVRATCAALRSLLD